MARKPRRSATRPTSGLKTPGIWIGAAAQASRRRRPGLGSGGLGVIGAPAESTKKAIPVLRTLYLVLRSGARRWRMARQGRVLIWVVVALLVVFLGLIGYQKFVNRSRVSSDPERLKELQDAKNLADEES